MPIGIYEHPIDLISTSPHIYKNKNIAKEYKPNWSQDDINDPPVIGNDVWIGSNVIIKQGIHIGDGAIIAAGAVVTKNVKSYNVVGGVPASVIKKRFSDDIIELLIEFRWWDKPEEWINSNINKFIRPEEFIKMIQDQEIIK